MVPPGTHSSCATAVTSVSVVKKEMTPCDRLGRSLAKRRLVFTRKNTYQTQVPRAIVMDAEVTRWVSEGGGGCWLERMA